MFHLANNFNNINVHEQYFDLIFEKIIDKELNLEDHAPTIAQTMERYLVAKLNQFKKKLTSEEYSKGYKSTLSLINKGLTTNNLDLFTCIYEELKNLTLDSSKTLQLFSKINTISLQQKNYLKYEFK